MSTYEVVLSLHILAAVFGFATAGVAHSTMFRLRSARDMGAVRSHLAVLDKVGPFFGISALLLIIFGAWMIHIAPKDEPISWRDGWIRTALVTLVVAEAIGGAVIGRRVKAIITALEAVPDGPVTAQTRSLLADRPVWFASHVVTATIASVVFVMVGKPSGVGAVVTVLIGAVVGIVSAIPFAKPVAVAA